MIHREGFSKGDQVEFQNYQHVWVRGTVQVVEPAEHKLEGPGIRLTEKSPGRVHVLYFDSKARAQRVVVLPTKRVRAAR